MLLPQLAIKKDVSTYRKKSERSHLIWRIQIRAVMIHKKKSFKLYLPSLIRMCNAFCIAHNSQCISPLIFEESEQASYTLRKIFFLFLLAKKKTPTTNNVAWGGMVQIYYSWTQSTFRAQANFRMNFLAKHIDSTKRQQTNGLWTLYMVGIWESFTCIAARPNILLCVCV